MKVYIVVEERYEEDPWYNINHSSKLHEVYSMMESAIDDVRSKSEIEIQHLRERYKSSKWVLEEYGFESSVFNIDILDESSETDISITYHVYEREIK